MPYKHNEPRRHKIPKAKYKVSNWREYDQALQQRGSLTVWVTPEALEAWAPAKTGQRGRPTSYSDIVIETAVMLRSIIQILGLDLPVPDHTTFARRSARLSLTTALKKPKGPINVVIDSSGLKIFGAGEWLHEKHGGKPRRSWRRLHLAVDPDSGDILAAELTTTDEGDASLVGPPLERIDGPVSADGAYDGEPIYRTVAERHPDAAVVIPPRSTAVPSDTAETEPTQRDQHIQRLAEKGRLGWQKAVDYGRRSLVETAFYRYKVLIGRSLRARTLSAQKIEARIACAVINRMTSLGMPVSRKVA
jgi:transposase